MSSLASSWVLFVVYRHCVGSLRWPLVPKVGRKRRFTSIMMITRLEWPGNKENKHTEGAMTSLSTLDGTPLVLYIAEFVFPEA